MKNALMILSFAVILAACGNASGGAGADKTTNPSDTTGTNVNPAVNDPNSNMADTMRMKDSLRVKDTSVKDKTSVTPRKQ
jgi:PBP1b-binding outer membrane lipoprotein LpoB